MADEAHLRSILSRIDDLRREVASMLPDEAKETPNPFMEEAVSEEPVHRQPLAEKAPAPEPPPHEPSAFDLFWERVGDWFCVRGDFAPEGMTREFAVATRWLLRIGSLMIVGAMGYFVTLAISKGWIGPTQRVCSMIFWGTVATFGGTWLKLKRERYAILGEVIVAIGVAALYFGFGLGHRYFKPPVIPSVWVAFAGLVLTTSVAGILSVRLRSLAVAVLGLVGGFLVPMICKFSTDHLQLSVYLLVLVFGASIVAYLRRWMALGSVAIVTAFAVAFSTCGQYPLSTRVRPCVGYVFHLIQYGCVLALVVAGRRRRVASVNAWCWAFVAFAAFFWSFGALAQGTLYAPTLLWTKLHFFFVAFFFAVLAVVSRTRYWGATPVMLALSTVGVVAAVLTWCHESHQVSNYAALIFSVFSAVLVELSVRSREKSLGFFALFILAGLGAFWLGGTQDDYRRLFQYWPGLADRIFDYWSVPAAIAFAAWRLSAANGWDRTFRIALGWIAFAAGFVILSEECRWLGVLECPSLGTGLMTIVWAALAAGMLTGGILCRIRVLRLTGLGVLGFAVVKILLADSAKLATPARVAVFAAVGVLMIVGAFLYLKFKSRFEK